MPEQSRAVPLDRAVIRPRSPLREMLPWALLAASLLVVLLYFVGADQGATSLVPGDYVHEWVHDGRHLLGFPCH